MKITNEEERKLVLEAIHQRLGHLWDMRRAMPLSICPLCMVYATRLPDENGVMRCTNEIEDTTCPVQVECEQFIAKRDIIMDKIHQLQYWFIGLKKKVEE